MIDHLRHFRIGYHLSCSDTAMGWEGGLRYYDPVPVSKLIYLLIHRIFPISGIRK